MFGKECRIEKRLFIRHQKSISVTLFSEEKTITGYIKVCSMIHSGRNMLKGQC